MIRKYATILCITLWAGLALAEQPVLKLEADGKRVTVTPDLPANSYEFRVIGSTLALATVDAQGRPQLWLYSLSDGQSEPTPGPTPPSPAPLTGLAKVTYDAAMQVPAEGRAAVAAKLADSFQGLASQIAAGTLTTVPEILKAAQESNRAALGDAYESWTVVRSALRDYLNAESAAGRLVEPAHYKAAFMNIEAGLRRVR